MGRFVVSMLVLVTVIQVTPIKSVKLIQLPHTIENGIELIHENLNVTYISFKNSVQKKVKEYQGKIARMLEIYKFPIDIEKNERYVEKMIKNANTDFSISKNCIKTEYAQIDKVIEEGNLGIQDCLSKINTPEIDSEFDTVEVSKALLDQMVLKEVGECLKTEEEYEECLGRFIGKLNKISNEILKFMDEISNNIEKIIEEIYVNFAECLVSISEKLNPVVIKAIEDLATCVKKLEGIIN